MSTEQFNTENIVEEVTNVVTETSPVVEASEAVQETVAETSEVPEATEEKESKTKSFFAIFKKDKEGEPVEEAASAAEGEAVADSAEEAAAADSTEAAAAEEDVPVETAPAKKGSLCGLCALGKKSEDAPAETTGTTDETAAEETPAAEEAATDAAEEAATDATEEAAPEAAAPAVATEEAPVETTEGEAAAPVEDANLVRSGALFKSGKFFKSNLNERHCRLFTTGAFQCSKSEDFSKANECKVSAETTTVAFMAEGEETAHKYRFELHCCGTVTTYAMDSEEDRDEWIRAFETVKESLAACPCDETAKEAAADCPCPCPCDEPAQDACPCPCDEPAKEACPCPCDETVAPVADAPAK